MTLPELPELPELPQFETTELEAVMTPTRLEVALDVVRTVAQVVAAVALVIIAA